MVSLYLIRMRRGNAEDVRRRKDWLDSIGAVLERMLGAEARMWLITSLSSLEFRLRIKVNCFLDLFQNTMRESCQRRGKRAHGPLELQYTRMLFKDKPRCALRPD